MYANICRVKKCQNYSYEATHTQQNRQKIFSFLIIFFTFKPKFLKIKKTGLNLVDQGPLDVISEALIPDDGIVQRDTGDNDGSGDHD
jgi:hypothetical protein